MDGPWPDEYEFGERILQALGTFWSNIFLDQDSLRHFYRGSMLEAAQAFQRFLEAVNALSRFDLPVFRQENWDFITFRESDINNRILRYGDGALYGEGYAYGVRFQTNENGAPTSENLVGARFAFNRITDPTLSFTEGVDFRFDTDRNLLLFKNNPFDDSRIPKNNIVVDGSPDREAGLWLYKADYDLDLVWKHFGYVLGVYMRSSQDYKDFLNAMGDGYTDGPSLKVIQLMVSALAGVPLVKEEQEKVLHILEYPNRKQVVTDFHVYTFPPASTILVSVGETVIGGQALTGAVDVVEINTRQPLDPGLLPAMALGPRFLRRKYFADLVFENKKVALDYLGIDEDNKAIVRFEVSGFPGDVDQFWYDVDQAGKEGGKMLSDYLDTRTNPVGPPAPGALPSTVNPLELIINQIMGNNLFIIKLRPTEFDQDAPGSSFFTTLRQVIPPHTTYVVYVEMEPPPDYIDLTVDAEEEQEFFSGIPVEDEILDTSVEEVVVVTSIAGECE